MKIVFKLLLLLVGLYVSGVVAAIVCSMVDPDNLMDKKGFIESVSWKIMAGGGIAGSILIIPILTILSTRPEAIRKIKFHNFLTIYAVASSYRKELPWAWRLGKLSLCLIFGGFLLVIYLNLISSIL